MSAKTFVVDSGGTTRRIKKWFVVDSGGTTRKLKKVWNVDAGGTTRLVFSAEDDISMLVGTSGSTGANGFAAGGFGSVTPNTLGDGSVVREIAVGVHTSATPFQLVLQINNYPGTITQSYLTSLMINASLFAPGDANFTSFTGGGPGGTAQWIWQNAGVPTVGATIPVVIVRS